MAKVGRFSRDERSHVERHVEEDSMSSWPIARSRSRARRRAGITNASTGRATLPHRRAGDFPGRKDGRRGRSFRRHDFPAQLPSGDGARPGAGPGLSAGGRAFDPGLCHPLLRAVGIYPVGSSSAWKAAIWRWSRNCTPSISSRRSFRVIYHAGRRRYVAPVLADLAAPVGNHYGQIVRAEILPTGLSAIRWQPV